MKKVINIQNENLEKDLTNLQQTNRLFLDLLYNLSKYPHCEIPKKYVRAGLFAFEEQVCYNPKAKKNNRY